MPSMPHSVPGDPTPNNTTASTTPATAMSVERMRFSDLNGSVETTTFNGRRRGCQVSIVSGFILALLAVTCAVGVGLIVHFASASSRTVQCHCSYSPGYSTSMNSSLVTGSSSSSPSAASRAVQVSSAAAHTSTLDANTDQLWESCVSLAASKNECLISPNCPGAGDLSTPSPTTEAPPTDVRLPLNFYPLHYNVELRPDMYGPVPEEFTFDGKVDVFLACKTASDVVVLHIHQLEVDNSTIDFRLNERRLATAGSGGAHGRHSHGRSAPAWKRWEEDEPRQFFKLYLDKQCVVGEEYVLHIEFHGNLTDNLAGLYRSSYKDGNTTRWIASTQFQPTDARTAFPCMDEPAIKATFNITLLRRQHMTALSNMPRYSSEYRHDDWIADHFQKTVKMSTYLLAFLVCDYEHKEKTTASGTRFRVWARSSAISQVDYALDVGVRIIDFFEDYFGIKFPLPKQDMAAIPDFAAGAMENWGLILYRETALLYDPQASSTGNKQKVAVVVSHELAHQWFGNLVTPSWWDDLWLNEGFASYVEYLGVNHVHPDWKMMDQFITGDVQDVFATDGLGTSHPIFVPVNHPDEINEIFDRISYGKGASVIRMMNYFLGESTFRNGLTKYLRRHQYAEAHHKDLWKALEEQAHEDGDTSLNVQEVMDTWVLQMGYPVITITRDTARRDVAHVVQEHFLLDPSQPPIDKKYPPPFDYKWMVPLTYTTSVDLEWTNPIRVWMRKGDVSLAGIPTSANWVIANIDQQGYYRVNYDDDNWMNLIETMRKNHKVIPVKNRAQIIDDAFNLGRSGRISQVVGLQTTEYLLKEEEFLPWEAATSNLRYIEDMLARSDSYGLFEKYILRQVLPTYNRLGWEMEANAPHLQRYLRVITLGYACGYGHKDCHQKASELFRKWMSTPDVNPINPDLRALVYCYAMANGGQNEWNFAYKKYKSANLASEKDKLLYGMACTRQPWLLSRFLRKTLDKSEIRKQDAVFTIAYIARNPIGRFLAWDFVRAHWDYIKFTFAGGFFASSRLVTGVTESFNTEFEVESLKTFIDSTGGSSNRAFQQAIERAQGNLHWMKHNLQNITLWLEDALARDIS